MMPTLGRIVHVKMSGGPDNWSAAIVTEVVDDGQFHVTIFSPQFKPYPSHTSLLVGQEGIFWRWPPKV
jgi:hypothetical protein